MDRLGFRWNYEIAAYAGNLARKVVSFAVIAHIQVRARLADAIVKHALEKFQLRIGPNEQVLSFKDEDLRFIEWFENAIQKIKLKAVSH